MPAKLAGAEVTDHSEIAARVVPSITETVKKQVDIGIDCIGDGEFWTGRNRAHYAAHFTGIEVRALKPGGSVWQLSGAPPAGWYVFQMLAGIQDGDVLDTSNMLNN